jgi:hypothetical protein
LAKKLPPIYGGQGRETSSISPFKTPRQPTAKLIIDGHDDHALSARNTPERYK